MRKVFLLVFLFSATLAQAQPVLKGGLSSFIQKNIVYPAYSWQNCIQGKIDISFKLNTKGEVYFSEVSRGLGIDLDKEALRLIRMSSGQWQVPAGFDTTFVIVAPVNFILSGDDCIGKSPADMQKAIATYKAAQGLTDAVTNFYRNKANGTYNAAEQPKIDALKNELGYDEAFFQEKIKEGEKKLKQRDFQGACEDFLFVKYMGSALADALLDQYCK